MAVASVDDEYLSYNFTMPTYWQFLTDVAKTASKSVNRSINGEVKVSWIETWSNHIYISRTDIQCLLFLAVFWTLLRYIVTAIFLKPLALASNLGEQETLKAPESAWKLIFYSLTWSYAIKLLFYSNYQFFEHPPLAFYKWQSGHDVPGDIYGFYMVQLSFYVHSVYGTLCMDVWRKDSYVMMLHHFVTLLLLGFSYAMRYTNIGILILFLHDVTDIFLEATKLVLYHKTKGGMWTTVCDALSTAGFVGFGLAWFIFRLYWYPLKAMYSAGHASVIFLPDEEPFYLFFNVLLWILLCMNIYWFKFILVMAYHVVTGKVKEIDDTREYEEDGHQSHDSGKKEATNGHAKNGVSKKHR